MKAKPEHVVAYDELIALVRRHADKMTALELLAVAANMLGKLIAMQDQRYVSSDRALAIVRENINLGNKQALQEISNPTGSA